MRSIRRLAAATALLLLAACSQTQSTTPGGENESSSAPPPVAGDGVSVAFVSQIEGIPYFNGMKAGGERAAEDLGISYTQTGPATTNSAEQLKILDSLVTQGYDAIAVSPLDPNSINNSIAEARAAGVAIATSDADAPDSERQVFVSQATDEALGATAMDELANAVGGSGEYGIISGGADTATFNNWIAAIEAQAAAEYPDMELVGGVRYTTDTANALAEAENLMTAFPDIKGIIAVPSTAVPGVGQAVQNQGKIGEVAVTGFGSPQTAGPFLDTGAMTSTVLWDVDKLGYLTVWALNELAEGREFAPENEVPGFDEPVVYDEGTQTLLLGEPSVFTKDNWADYDY
nr:autoinducer 2 ABC transporter substrate-binding protein [Ornithinimicrobium sp. HY1745]